MVVVKHELADRCLGTGTPRELAAILGCRLCRLGDSRSAEIDDLKGPAALHVLRFKICQS